jgi:hypothetical protein
MFQIRFQDFEKDLKMFQGLVGMVQQGKHFFLNIKLKETTLQLLLTPL